MKLMIELNYYERLKNIAKLQTIKFVRLKDCAMYHAQWFTYP